MPRFNLLQRQLRRSKLLRRLMLLDLKSTRKKLADAVWAHEHSILTNLGLYVTLWAGIERMLNTFIVNYHEHASEKLKRNGFPSTLKQKITYLASVSQDTRLPDGFRLAVKEWVQEIGQQRDYRHMLVHGVGSRRRSYFRHEWTYQKLTIAGDQADLEEKVFTNDDLQANLRRAAELSSSIASILNPLLFPS